MKKIIVLATAFCCYAFLLPGLTAGALNEGDYDYVLDKNMPNVRMPIPKTYVMTKSWNDFGEQVGTLSNVQDLFIDTEDKLYIVDTGNNRIIKCDLDGRIIRVISGEGKTALASPEGIFVYEDGDLFVADTENCRILHLGPDGSFVEEFHKPDSEMLEPEFIFNPRKIVVSPTGYLYSIKYQLLMQMDSNNEFRGYVGSTKVDFSFTRMLINIFGSREQKAKVAKAMPAAYTNFVLGRDGFFYATTLDYKNGQIKKVTTTGNNVYPVHSFGENILNRQGMLEKPVFEDIAVDTNGIVTVCERLSAKLYQYDQEGNLLAVFGGLGTAKDQLLQPRSIETDSRGRIYVYDAGRNEICVYEPTDFIQTVHAAVTAYNMGAYNSALRDWEKVRDSCETYALAQIGIGKTYFKQGLYQKSMEAFRLGGDKAQYSKAFGKYRYQILQEHFLGLAVVLAAGLAILFFSVRYLKKLSDFLEKKYLEKRRAQRDYLR